MMMNKMQGRWLIVIAFSGSFIATRAADATPWRVRGNTDGRAKRLLSRLEADPRDDSGIQAFIALLGPRRALTLARQHAHGGSWAGSFIVGRLLLLAKQPKHALVAFRQALGRAAQSKGTAGLLGWIGEALVNAGEVPAAKRLLQRWRKKRPKDQGALRLSIRLALAARDTRRACTLQGKLAHLRPKDTQVWTVYARLLKKTGELSQAASAYKTALKHLAQDPALRCQLLRELGHILETLERFDAAVGHYKEALKLSRRGSYVHRALSARILTTYRRRGAMSQLVAEAQAMLVRDGKNSLALLTLARAMARAPRTLNKAIGFYERYLRIASQDVKVRNTLMFILLRLNRKQEAVKHAAKLHALQPNVARRLLEYVGLLTQLGRPKEARDILSKAVELARKRKDGDTLALIAEALHRLGHEKSARAAFALTLALDGRDPRYHRRYGRYLWDRTDREKAIATWSASLGPKATHLTYARWVETIERVSAWRYPRLRTPLKRYIARGLSRFPKHPSLHALKAHLKTPSP